ncbi:hypothetical protein H5410_025938 [Solanum commersonii]|uniref:Uncharacterized protein n=1 Tax=Solanum commersonii TaxID=4109 RepID=A0A9J5YZZ6_SOLCO|nr:hypothetical protein H5410_025938 [Solanum commersonii]
MAFKKINDVSCKYSTIATYVDFSDVYPITRREFKTSSLNEFEYFSSLEMERKSKSQRTLKTTIPEGNITSKLFDELSHSSFNFSESKNSIDSLISTKVNSLMVDTTDMDEKFTMMEQTIKALKKSIDDKNLQIAELMSNVKLDYDLISEVLRPVASPKIEEDVIILQFGSFEPVEVSALKKTTNTSKVDDFSNKNNDDTWILVARKRQKHQGTSKL